MSALAVEPQKATISYNLREFAQATGMSLSSVKVAIDEGAIRPRYAKSKPLIGFEDGKRWFESLPEVSSRRQG